MIRKIIKIDPQKCIGCGLCVNACHEGAIGMVEGKARLLRDDYCDGLGDCLPVCPTDAISFEEREAAAFDSAAVLKHQEQKAGDALPCGCPGSQSRTLKREQTAPFAHSVSHMADAFAMQSQLKQWPVQIKLVPTNAPYFDGAHLLIAADCAAYAHGNFHQDFMKNRITLIGCPKLDMTDYSERIFEILKSNAIKSLTVVRMEVPCCGGLEHAAITALKNCGKMIPWQVVTIATDGSLKE